MIQAVFLDRDGTLNVKPADHEYVTAVKDFKWLPGAVDGVVALARAGVRLAVVSNQRGVARGLIDPAVLAGIEELIQAELAVHGCRIEAFSYCLHDLDDACECRKPRPGMLIRLAQELGLDLTRTWMVGDSATDVQAGRAAGCRTVQITRGIPVPGADAGAASLSEAAALILQSSDQPAAAKPSTSAS
ncbi:MAG TPA: HAD family hydrolase [Solirubrobacteraceae bacterium]|nr:HAD family hydrolase [Solirubrobacteraceae bacterium]